MSISEKVILAGESGVGKTGFVARLTGSHLDEYIPTMGVSVRKIHGCAIWDTAGRLEYAGLGEGYYVGGRYAILMWSSNIAGSKDALANYRTAITRVCGNIPMIEVNSVDIEDPHKLLVDLTKMV
jgi:GTP-binding nuclear protein Ran